MSQENEKILGMSIRKGPRMIYSKYGATGKFCPPDMEYCWICGHVAKLEDFLKDNKCPNPSCTFPEGWND